MPDVDDGGFARREGRDDGGFLGRYFECEVREVACADLKEDELKACDCSECEAYRTMLVEADEAERDAEDFPEAGDKCGTCGSVLDKDCSGRVRCPQCDPPCPQCDDS